MTVLTLPEAASLLKVGVKTVEKLARGNVIPAKKIGREWRFVQERLEAWLSGDYDNHALQAIGETKEINQCQSKYETSREFGGSTSATQTANEYAKVVALPIKNRRKSSMTS